MLYRKNENYEKAIENYCQEITFSGTNSNSLRNRAFCLAKLELYQEVKQLKNSLYICNLGTE